MKPELQIPKKDKVITKKRNFQMPHVYVILFIFSAIAALCSYIIPAGKYERVSLPSGRQAIDPNSYQQIEQTPIGLIDFMVAIPKGMVSAGEVVFFTFIIGGMFMVLRRTGIIEIGVDKLTRRFSNNSSAVIPVLIIVFAVIASLIGTQELALVYVPVILPIMIALRYDSITAAAVALCATTAGFATGMLNPINTGLGQQIAGIDLYSGLGLRVVSFIVFVTIAIVYIMRYAQKVKSQPELSLVYYDDKEKRDIYFNTDQSGPRTASKKQKIASLITFLFLGILVYGVITQGWFMMEMAGLFIIMGIVVGLVAGLKTMEICEAFNKGFRDVLVGAMIVGVARAVAVVMEDGNIMDTVVFGLGIIVSEFPPIVAAIGMFIAQLFFNFLVPSGSGQALVTMPIMAPLSDIIGVTRQTAVLAYQLGDGLGNILYPTSGYFMATLALAGVAWHKWVKFFFPLFLLWVLAAVLFLIFAQFTHWTGI